MDFKRMGLASSDAEDFITALKFEVATARCERVQILRVDLCESAGDEEAGKFFAYVSKVLRSMKQKGIIQFFASPESFRRHSTEAVFLLNKYPEYVDEGSLGEKENYLFIKL